MTVDFEMYSGDNREQPFAVFDSTGNAVDVSTANEITYRLSVGVGGETIFTKTMTGGDITVATSTIIVIFVPADTAALAGRYAHEIEIVDGVGKKYTGLQGQMGIYEDIIDD